MNLNDMQAHIRNLNVEGLDSRQRSLRGTALSRVLDENLSVSAAITLLASFGPAKKSNAGKPVRARN